MRKTGPRQLGLVFADNPSGSGTTEPPDASGRRSFLLHKARHKKTRGPGTGVADTSRLLEEAASEANLAQALLNVVRNKGAPGTDGQTIEAAEAKAPSIFAPSAFTGFVANMERSDFPVGVVRLSLPSSGLPLARTHVDLPE